MAELEEELERVCTLETDTLTERIQAIGFECTRCGACCKGELEDPHTATVFPAEIRSIMAESGGSWRDIARPMPFGLDESGTGETFEWALATDGCGDCTFYRESEDGTGGCSIHGDHPLICQTYPFSLDILGGDQPMGAVVEQSGPLQAHECEGLGRDITREDAEELARTLKERAIRELQEAIAVREAYEPVEDEKTVVYDSEGPKRADGTPIPTSERL